jgi:hypothetical protein
MNNPLPEVKNVISVNVQHKAELEVLVLSDFIKEYKKLRLIGAKNIYYLIELPKPFVNGSFDPTRKYSIQLAYNKRTNEKLILINLDDSAPILSINNRRLEEVKK